MLFFGVRGKPANSRINAVADGYLCIVKCCVSCIILRVENIAELLWKDRIEGK